METRRNWSGIFKVLKECNCQIKFLHPEKNILQNKDKREILRGVLRTKNLFSHLDNNGTGRICLM